MKKEYEELKLKNQLCFPLYAASNAIIRKYKPYLDEIGLTYTQYITMMVLWENDDATLKDLEKCLKLGCGTLTPVLQKLEAKGYIEKYFIEEDQRVIIAMPTEEGEALAEKAKEIPKKIAKDFKLEEKEAKELYRILYKIIES